MDKSKQPLFSILLAFVFMLVTRIAWAQAPGLIEVGVYDDANFSGTRDEGERAVPNVQILVTGAYDHLPLETGPDGLARRELPEGIYAVAASPPAGWTFTTEIGAIRAEIRPGQVTHISIGFAQDCASVKLVNWQWHWPNTSQATVCLNITNNSNFAMHWVYWNLPSPAYFSPNPYHLNPPLQPGQSRTVWVELQQDWDEFPTRFCFVPTFHAADLSVCCAANVWIDVPPNDCFQFLDKSLICNPDGSFTFHFTIQNLNNNTINQILFAPLSPAGLTIQPNPLFLFGDPLSPGEIQNHTITLTGVSPGAQACFYMGLYNGGNRCCSRLICLDLPNCDFCLQCPEPCSGARPLFLDSPPSPLVNKSVALVTCAAFDPSPSDFVMGFMNLDTYECLAALYPSTAPGSEGDFIKANGITPRGFHAPNWRSEFMGNLFGCCFDDEGNVYVAQASCYNEDQKPLTSNWALFGGPLHGRIFKILSASATSVTIFNGFCNTGGGLVDQGIVSRPDPTISNRPNHPLGYAWSSTNWDERYPEIGDVCFANPNPSDASKRRIIATGLDEGVIYVYDMNGCIVQKYDPWGHLPADPAGFAPYGEMAWAVEYHCGRLYYSVWAEDLTHEHTFRNSIRSVAVNPSTGLIVTTPGADRKELDMPTNSSIGVGKPRSAPVSDISFKPNGNMGLAERSMGHYYLNGAPIGWQDLNSNPDYEHMVQHAALAGDDSKTSVYPHYARMLEFTCVGGNWVPSTSVYGVGYVASQQNSCGGLDYDYVTRCPDGSAAKPRVWITTDYANNPNLRPYFAPQVCPPGGSRVIYGLEGADFAGGNYLNSALVDVNDKAGTCDKSSVGDVEVPCRREGHNRQLSGQVVLGDFLGPIVGQPVEILLVNGSTSEETMVSATLDDLGRFSVDLPDALPNGQYVVCVKSFHWLRKAVTTELNGGGVSSMHFELKNGDVNNDNQVDLGDFAELSAAFGSWPGEGAWNPNADLDGSIAVDIGDYAILSEHYGEGGD